MGKVHPLHAGRGLGTALLAETERRAGARLRAGARAPFRTGTPKRIAPRSACSRRAGYRHVRSFWHMQRHLGEHPAPEPPEGITMRIGSAGDDGGPPPSLDDAFRDRFDYEPIEQADGSAACPGTTRRSW